MKLKDVCIKGTSNIRQKDVNDSGRYPVYGAAGPVGFMNSFQYDEPYVGVVKDGAGIGRATYLPSNSSIIGTMQALIPKKNVLPKYLYYAVSSMHLEKYYSGATIPHIYFKNYKHERFVLVSKKEQEQIIWRFSLLEKMISNKQQQLLKLDELIKARFVEMFGDPVLNSKKYPEKALANYINFITSGSRGWSKYLTPKGKAWFLTIKNVKNSHIAINNIQSVEPPDSKEAQRTKVKEGDLLISITADLGRTGVVSSDIASHGTYINQHLTCIRLDTEFINPVYASYFLESVAGKRQFNSKNQNGVKAGLNFDAIKSLKIIIPPIKKQNSFVSFVRQVDKSKFENIVYLNKTLSSKILSQIGDVIRD
ncbi:restriction endonuclease subunit S [Limosilactobacillus reuteri]|uniref:restriction endonuclease subunit S n=1 Tax=Limosilactobacillus reuteri TaxID=1598 RepID=UPI001E5B7012|nr:restriction endonuclease subunit S [Limosilactobacillus reuteri]MCC4423697.1 restriction endonuclease subunit S [Limosilactobacillus reuteri]